MCAIEVAEKLTLIHFALSLHDLKTTVHTLKILIVAKAPISLDCDCFATAGDRHREWIAKQSRNSRQ